MKNKLFDTRDIVSFIVLLVVVALIIALFFFNAMD